MSRSLYFYSYFLSNEKSSVYLSSHMFTDRNSLLTLKVHFSHRALTAAGAGAARTEIQPIWWHLLGLSLVSAAPCWALIGCLCFSQEGGTITAGAGAGRGKKEKQGTQRIIAWPDSQAGCLLSRVLWGPEALMFLVTRFVVSTSFWFKYFKTCLHHSLKMFLSFYGRNELMKHRLYAPLQNSVKSRKSFYCRGLGEGKTRKHDMILRLKIELWALQSYKSNLG